MSDDTSKRGGQDRTRINLNQEHEVRYWSQKFGVSADELRRAVEKAGTQAAEVEALLKGSKAKA